MAEPVRLEGNFRLAENNEIVGWALDPAAPDRPLDFLVMVDGEEHGRVRANLPRPDLTERLARTDVGLAHALDPTARRKTGADLMLIDRATLAPLPPGKLRLPAPLNHRIAPRFDLDGGQDLRLMALRHGWFLLNKHDLGVDKTMFDLGEYAESELRVMNAVLDPGRDIIDAGANIGALAVPLARRLNPEARLIAVEPQIGVFTRLCTALALNAIPNVVPVLSAVGTEGGMIEVPYLDEGRHHAAGGIRVDSTTAGEPIPMTTIDALRTQFSGTRGVGLIKIDVEGMEGSVVAGAERTILADRPSLYIEVRSRDAYGLIRRTLDPLGYSVFWHAADLYQSENHFSNPRDHYAGQGVNSNVIAVPKSLADRVRGLNDPNLLEAHGPEEFWPSHRFAPKIRPRIAAWAASG